MHTPQSAFQTAAFSCVNAMGQKFKCKGAGQEKQQEGKPKRQYPGSICFRITQPVPCQENIGRVVWSNLMQPQMVYDLFLQAPTQQRAPRCRDPRCCGVAILPPSVTWENKQIASLKGCAA